MRKSVILEMFNGERGDCQDMMPTQIQLDLMEKIGGYELLLREALSKEQFSLFQSFHDAKNDLECESVDTHYLEGFKLGLLIGIEAGEDIYQQKTIKTYDNFSRMRR